MGQSHTGRKRAAASTYEAKQTVWLLSLGRPCWRVLWFLSFPPRCLSSLLFCFLLALFFPPLHYFWDVCVCVCVSLIPIDSKREWGEYNRNIGHSVKVAEGFLKCHFQSVICYIWRHGHTHMRMHTHNAAITIHIANVKWYSQNGQPKIASHRTLTAPHFPCQVEQTQTSRLSEESSLSLFPCPLLRRCCRCRCRARETQSIVWCEQADCLPNALCKQDSF